MSSKLLHPQGASPIQKGILKQWHQELSQNPHFSEADFVKNTHLKEATSELLGQLIQTTEVVPEEPFKALEPFFALWHNVLKRQKELGFSTKDTAMMLYALKSGVTHLDNAALPDLTGFLKLLDILGLFTFELYSQEQERLIENRETHIDTLQTHQWQEKYGKLVAKSPAMQRVLKQIDPILNRDISVLLQGESGTGKDVIATLIHQQSNRKAHPFVAINCGAIPKELVESELFGHEKGSFTGAEQKRIGKVELAEGGTLFLDEVGELSLDLQVKLLRVLQNREIERVGGSAPIPVNVRVIAATNRDLKAAVDQKNFRLDLYYRLNVYPIDVPPLRHRREDILPLAQQFLTQYATLFQSPAHRFNDQAKAFLLAQDWEGNVRELENVIQRAVVLAHHSEIGLAELDAQSGAVSFPVLPQLATSQEVLPLSEVEKQAIQSAIQVKNGNLSQVAQALGISRTTLYSKMKQYHIKEDGK